MDYINHKVIMTSLERNFKSHAFNEEDILNWCQEVETLYIADPNAMVKYLQVPLKVGTQRRVKLPPNLFKLDDVYNYGETIYEQGYRIGFRRLPGQIILNKDPIDSERIMINYVGTPLDDECLPLINRNHQAACETFCKINSFEEMVAVGKFDKDIYFDWKQRFDGMIQGAKVRFDQWTKQEWSKMTIVMGNELPRIGFMPLAHLDIYNNDDIVSRPIDLQ